MVFCAWGLTEGRRRIDCQKGNLPNPAEKSRCIPADDRIAQTRSARPVEPAVICASRCRIWPSILRVGPELPDKSFLYVVVTDGIKAAILAPGYERQ
jgi:hypothetical protein